MKLWIKCQDASVLASHAMDRSLPLSARFALKLHHLVCENCARYARQLQQMRHMLRMDADVYPHDGAALSAPARQRIETELQKKLDS